MKRIPREEGKKSPGSTTASASVGVAIYAHLAIILKIKAKDRE